MEELRFSDYCANCRKSLADQEKLLFVEKEVGRCFCCEDCIQEYFQPTVQFMDEELQKARSDGDFSEEQSARFAHMRGLTLEDPDEIWVDQTETGERHYTFISHFRQHDERISYVVVCLALDGIPSFVFLSFATRDEDLVDEYRRGIDLRLGEESQGAATSAPGEPQASPSADVASEFAQSAGAQADLPPEAAAAQAEAAAAGEAVSVLEKLYGEMRQPGDIPREEFPKFNSFIELTLDDPEEIWRFVDEQGQEWCTFISRHEVSADDDDEESAEIEEFTMVVVCEPVFSADSPTPNYSLVFAFPTLDPGLVQYFRKGVSAWNVSGQKSFRTWRAGGRAA